MTPHRSPLLLGLALLASLTFSACGGGGVGSKGAGGGKKSPSGANQSGTSSSSGRQGSTPDEPAPALTSADLAAFQTKVNEAKDLLNEAENARRKDDHDTFKAKGKQAQEALEAAKEIVAEQLEWHSEADMNGWAMPAEYVTLENYFAAYSKHRKKARMIGN